MIDKNLIKILEDIAKLLELKRENPFKARAYSRAAQIIKEHNIDVALEAANGTLSEIEGIGDALEKKIKEYIETGSISYYEKIKKDIPEALVLMNKISGIGPRKALIIYEELGISSLEELEQACLDNRLAAVKGFGSKLQESILNGIEHKKASKGRYLQQEALNQANEILGKIRLNPYALRAEIAGSIRRFADTIRNIEYVVSILSPDGFSEILANEYQIHAGNRTLNFQLSQGMPVSIILAGPAAFIAALHEHTGNEEYAAAFRELLSEKGFRLNEQGILRDGHILEFHDETEIYTMLGLQYVPPELRESATVLDKAAENKIPHLLERQDLLGMIHIHSNWSDGENSLEEMALKTAEMGFKYMVICDHSRSAGYANGLSPERVRLQHKEIDSLNDKNPGFRTFKGIESDIHPDGSLDYDEETLKLFDIVIASVHSSLKMSRDEMTERICTALKNPYTTMLGHPTGRLLLVRQGCELNIDKIIETAADNGKIIEINCNPYRLDLSWENVIKAKERGVKISINPDSHRIETLSDIEFGVKVARKGWLEAKDVVNCLNIDDFCKYFSLK